MSPRQKKRLLRMAIAAAAVTPKKPLTKAQRAELAAWQHILEQQNQVTTVSQVEAMGMQAMRLCGLLR